MLIIISSLEIDREMAITLVNSDFRSNVKDSDEWDDYSPCDEHFDTRYAIGTHAADYHELKDWSSSDAHPTYVSRYRKVTSSITSHFRSTFRLFRLLMKGIFDTYVL